MFNAVPVAMVMLFPVPCTTTVPPPLALNGGGGGVDVETAVGELDRRAGVVAQVSATLVPVLKTLVVPER